MSRLDRLVRAVGPVVDDDEGLIGSVLGRETEGRAHLALVLTDRRLVVVRERFTHPSVETHLYGEVTSFHRQDAPGAIAVDIVTSNGRVRLDRISDEPAARVVLQLLERRIEAGGVRDAQATAATEPGPTPVRPMVRIVT